MRIHNKLHYHLCVHNGHEYHLGYIFFQQDILPTTTVNSLRFVLQHELDEIATLVLVAIII